MGDGTMGEQYQPFVPDDPNAVHEVRREIRRLTASVQLRYVLGMLTGGKVADEDRATYIYEALTCSSAVGYKCGIDMYGSWVGSAEMYAVIELPTGTIGFALSEYEGTDFMYEPDLVKPIVDAFIGDEGYGRS